MEIAIVGVEVDVTQWLEAPCPGIIVLPGALALVLLEEGFELTFDRSGFYALAEANIELLVAVVDPQSSQWNCFRSEVLSSTVRREMNSEKLKSLWYWLSRSRTMPDTCAERVSSYTMVRPMTLA